jgi:site-specific DNA-methyltransferase (adenine-specific)
MLEKRPLVCFTDIDGKYVVLGGNMRLKAANEVGLKQLPILLADDWTEEQKNEFLIKDNVGFGEWDWEQIKNDWDVEKLDEWGLDVPDFAATVLEAEEDEFDVPEGGIETDIVLGDLFEIGEHRLLCGDSTDSDQVAKLMNGQKADMVFTDPPYKIETEGGCKGNIGEGLRKQGASIEFISNFEPSEFLQVLPLIFDKNKLNAYIFCNKELLPDYLVWARDCGYSFNVLIWKKPNAIPIGDSHRPDIEYLLLFRKSAIWNNGLKDVNYSRCLEYGREKGLHPTMKPIELIANEMKISSNENSLVFDFFLGSGSTMVASHQLKRKCYGMELDCKYVEVIVQRMIKLDKTLIIKRNGIDETKKWLNKLG